MPLPIATDDHQTANARFLSDAAQQSLAYGVLIAVVAFNGALTVAFELAPPAPDDPLLDFVPVPHVAARSNSITPDVQRAALFLRRFADHPRYMHFDIYGHTPTDAPGRPKGGAGQGARAVLLGLPAMLGI